MNYLLLNKINSMLFSLQAASLRLNGAVLHPRTAVMRTRVGKKILENFDEQEKGLALGRAAKIRNYKKFSYFVSPDRC